LVTTVAVSPVLDFAIQRKTNSVSIAATPRAAMSPSNQTWAVRARVSRASRPTPTYAAG
jgi:hypothetical protein